ncbi:MAG: hypothetical protein F6K56_39400 [Moorea sp. SIO3G5]|nr:hypothetical protein [Moorena sp. SIO3G5]
MGFPHQRRHLDIEGFWVMKKTVIIFSNSYTKPYSVDQSYETQSILLTLFPTPYSGVILSMEEVN